METTQTIILNRIITAALKRKATDLHLSVGNNPILRVDNKLYVSSDEEIITADFLNNLAQSLLDEERMRELEKNREISIIHDYGNQIRVRINGFYQKNFLTFSFRFISPVIPSPKILGLPRVINDLIGLKSGLIIVGGNYDSGRTTTVFSLLEEINRTQNRYILTLENPIEFLMASNKSIVLQRNITKDVNSYEDGLGYCEDEDVDVIMIDRIDASQGVLLKAFELANSGKLVIGIINAGSVIGAIEKIMSEFDDNKKERAKFLFNNSLECVFIQKLVPRIGGGRILVPEILLATEPVRAIIKEGRIYQLNNILQTSREEGMRGIDRSLADLVSTGEISLDDALEYANNKDSFQIMMK
ncbi:MAG: ATPase, T2SS/T4P/T4SS family [bacterium]